MIETGACHAACARRALRSAGLYMTRYIDKEYIGHIDVGSVQLREVQWSTGYKINECRVLGCTSKFWKGRGEVQS